MEELSRRIREINAPIFAYEIVKRMITKAMDLKLREVGADVQHLMMLYIYIYNLNFAMINILCTVRISV
jgi:hypothetical protein